MSLTNRTLIHGDKKGGFTVFWADDGLDTGPILLQRECDVEPNDTVNTIYKRFLFPEGVKGTVSLILPASFKVHVKLRSSRDAPLNVPIHRILQVAAATFLLRQIELDKKNVPTTQDN